MNTLRTTNRLLFALLLVFLIDIGLRLGATPAVAETFQLDDCITVEASEEPNAYVHVVTHGSVGGGF